MATKSINVNGKRVSITIDDPDMPLLYALRDNLALKGPRFGCGLAQCGACTVHVDGSSVRSCVTPLSSIRSSQKVVTLEGLGTPQKPHAVQRAFIEEQAVQCGYCINGMIMESAAFLAKNPSQKVRLEGHADERGSREYNIGLGERRGQAVRRALLLQGVAEAQLSTVSYGEERPAVAGSDEQAYALNRRVEIVYLK